MNEQQLRAATIQADRIAVVAGPGAGKTHTLTTRIKMRETFHLSRVILTFTNAGAHELSERLKGVEAQFIGTLHGYCFRLLQRHGELLGYRKGGVNLIGENDADGILLAVAKEMGWKKSLKALRARGCHLSQQVWLEYEHRLKRDNMVDYDVVLSAASKLLLLPDVAESAAVDELYVDEAQDSAEIDWIIYQRIPAASMFVVGDPDQSIFAFRGAWPEGFHRYIKNATAVVYLETNYRSGQRICKAASDLIGNNTNRLPKAVLPALDFSGNVVVRSYPTDFRELDHVVSEVRRLIEHNMAQPEEIAILCRRNKDAGAFSAELIARGVPVANPRHGVPIDTQDWQYGIDVLRLFHDPRSDLIAGRVIGSIAGQEKLRAAKAAKLASGKWLSDEARRMGILPRTPLDFIECLPNVLPTLAQWDVSPEMVDVVGKRIALLPQTDARLQDLLHDLFNHEKWTPGAKAIGVAVSTMHGAKGREWPVVFLPGFEEGTVPTIRKDAPPEAIEEERRLAFVAMTRAKNELRISWAASRFAWGRTVTPEPSRFIGEAGL